MYCSALLKKKEKEKLKHWAVRTPGSLCQLSGIHDGFINHLIRKSFNRNLILLQHIYYIQKPAILWNLPPRQGPHICFDWRIILTIFLTWKLLCCWTLGHSGWKLGVRWTRMDQISVMLFKMLFSSIFYFQFYKLFSNNPYGHKQYLHTHLL